jgi:hypothetical protein
MTDDNIIGIDGRQAAQLRTDQAEREKREEIVRTKLKCVGFKLQPGMVPPVTRSRTRTLRSHRILMDGAICRWTKWKMPRQTLTWARIHASAVAN